MTQLKPNVIMMFIDDLGYGDLSCFNENSKISTPNIDRLASEGVSMTDCHATSALCTPSRYGLLTGRYNWRSRLKSSVLPGGAPPLIESDRKTMATLFHEQGYYTAAVGKWHLGLGWVREEIDGGKYGIAEEVEKKKSLPGAAFILDGMNIDYSKELEISPNDYGFDYFFGTAASLDQPPYVYIENRKALSIPDRVTGVDNLDRRGATQQQGWQRGPAAADFDFEQVIPVMQKKVVDLIDEHAKEPFFIYYPIHAVHGPLFPPKEFEGKSGLNVYADMVLYLDHMVGELLEKLEELKIRDNTIFVFASDNGCSGVADYPLLTSHGHNPSYIFRGMKADIYEGGHRVPAIISWPDRYKDAKICDSMTCLSDLYATFAEIIGADYDDGSGEDSISLLPAIDGQGSRTSVVHSSGDGSFSIRRRDWKLELCRGSGGGLGKPVPPDPSTSDKMPYQLYNLTEDIREKVNVAAAHPDICLDMLRELLEIIYKGRTTQGEKQENAGMDSWAQLKALEDTLEKMIINQGNVTNDAGN